MDDGGDSQGGSSKNDCDLDCWRERNQDASTLSGVSNGGMGFNDDNVKNEIVGYLPSGNAVCNFFLAGAPELCNYDLMLSFFTSENYGSLPYVIMHTGLVPVMFYDAYTPNALGGGVSASGGYNIIQSTGGIDFLYTLEDGSTGLFLHGGPAPGIGGGLSGTRYGVVGLNIDQISDYEGSSQSIEFNYTQGIGLRVGYFWPAFRKPFQPNDSQGFYFGPTVGEGISANYTTQIYELIWMH